jgi:hypothetical protein
MGEMRNAYCVLNAKPEGLCVRGKIIRMDLRERGWEGVAWINLTQDRDQWRALLNTVKNIRVP